MTYTRTVSESYDSYLYRHQVLSGLSSSCLDFQNQNHDLSDVINELSAVNLASGAPVNIVHLREVERRALQKVAVSKLQAINLGCSVTLPKSKYPDVQCAFDGMGGGLKAVETVYMVGQKYVRFQIDYLFVL